MDWNFFHVWLEERGREIAEIPPDGLCFLHALQHCLLVQYNEKYSLKEIQEKILHEIKSKTQYYMAFHTASTPTKIISQVQQYFDTRRFACDIVDVIIGLCCNIFSATLWIFQSNAAEKMDSISYTTDEHTAKRRHIHMVLYHERGDKEGFGNHYNAVVSQNKNKGQMYADIQPDTTSGPPSPGTYQHQFPHLHIKMMTLIQLMWKMMDNKTSALSLMHLCTICLLLINAYFSLWIFSWILRRRT